MVSAMFFAVPLKDFYVHTANSIGFSAIYITKKFYVFSNNNVTIIIKCDEGADYMFQNGEQHMVVYIIGFVLQVFFLIRSFFVKNKNLINMSGIEKDDRKFGKVRFLYILTQIISLVMFIICFIYVKNFYIAMLAFAFCILFPICSALLYDTFLIRKEQKRSEE